MVNTRQRMIEAAAGLLRTRGMTATSFTEVLVASGASRGVIYHHFPGGKAELAREAVAWTGRSVRSRLAMIHATDPLDVIAQFLEAVRPAIEQSAGGKSCAVSAVTMESAQIDSALTEAVHIAFRSWVEELDRQLVRTGATSDAAATLSMLMVTFLEGAHVLCRAAGSVEPFDRSSPGIMAAGRSLLDMDTGAP